VSLSLNQRLKSGNMRRQQNNLKLLRGRRMNYRATVLISVITLGSACFAAAQPLFGNGQNPLSGIEDTIATKAFTAAASTLLNNQLPITLNAKSAYPTVATLPGPPFSPIALQITPAMLSLPLPPGDYVINVWAFCTEYSVHRPGRGVAYDLAPLQGKLSKVVATILWRGTMAKVSPQQLMGVTWAIQAGLVYDQMPQDYKSLIDQLVPDYKGQLNGDFFQQLQDSYATAAKAAHLPPLDSILGSLGDAGSLALGAERQRQALLQQNTSDQQREQDLFAGQDNGVFAPVGAQQGAWTVRIPGVAYLRYQIQSGNLASDNIIQIRIVAPANIAGNGSAVFKLASAGAPQAGTLATQDTNLMALLGATQGPNGIDASGVIGYPQGQGAQDVIPVPVLCDPGGLLPPAQGTQPLCGDPTLPFNYDVLNQNYHYYTDYTIVCQKSQSPLCTLETVFTAMISTPATTAPVLSTVTPQQIQNCATIPLETVPANLSGYNNLITMVINPSQHSLTNYTQKTHVFYPGQITRQIVDAGDSIQVETIGQGVGCYKCANIVGGSCVIWPDSDQALREAVWTKLNLGQPPAIASSCNFWRYFMVAIGCLADESGTTSSTELPRNSLVGDRFRSPADLLENASERACPSSAAYVQH
jgi:hypothetical protein